MRVLVVGSGSREHALARAIAKDESVAGVLCAPGNGGTATCARNVAVSATDLDGLEALVETERVDFVVVGPEAPLVAGLADVLRAKGVLVFGPSRAAAQLEGSKIYSKELMVRANVPTAAFRVFDDPAKAIDYVRAEARPLVVKADGLAAGKGVVVAADAAEAEQAIHAMMIERAHGDAGARVLVEDTLVGEEVSFHAVCDGARVIALAPAQDHKRAFDGDRGPNTGGMGAYSAPPAFGPELEREVMRTVVEPTLRAMDESGAPFSGVLFVGLMLTERGPKVLEYNVRFGDPECQTLLSRLAGSPLPLLLGAARGDLSGVTLRWDAPASLSVVLAAPGYPGAYPTGAEISGIEDAERVPSVSVLHGGTARDAAGTLVTAGGRVLSVSASGHDVDEAASRAYQAASLVRFEGVHYRRDIGARARRKS